MILQVGVKILLKNQQGKFLLIRRNPKVYKDTAPEWEIVGGRIDPGSELLENLKREVKEETGLVYNGQPKLVGAQDILVRGYADGADKADTIQKHIVRLTYTGEIEGEPSLSEEHTEAKWFTAEEIKSLPKSEIDRYFKELWDAGKFSSLS